MPQFPFAIELTTLPDGKYRICVNPGTTEEIQAQAKSPFTQQEINEILEILSRRKPGLMRMEETRAARQFGQKLFHFLIKDNPGIYTAYQEGLRRDGLRIQLSVEQAGPLTHLPWELLRDPDRDFLALADSTPVVRSTPKLGVRPPVPLLLPLRVLVVMAGRAVDQEWQSTEHIQIDRLDKPTLNALRRRMLADDYQILHMIVPGVMDKKTEESFLLMNDDGLARVTSDDLNHEIYPESTVRLVVLASQQPQKRALVQYAGRLSVPAVVTTQFSMSGRAESRFYAEFYRTLVEGLPVDMVVSRARRAIANHVPNNDWAAPVLFLRSHNARLFRPLVTQ